MKALPLPSPKVSLSLRFNRYYGQLRFPCRPDETSSPYIHSSPPCVASARASRAIPHDFPCVSPLLPRESICRFWQFSLRQMLQPSPPDHRVSNSSAFTRLPIGSLPLQPAGLLGSPSEPLSGNLVLQVTLNTSLLLRGGTAEFPRPDLNWQVTCLTRHTIRNDEFLHQPIYPHRFQSSRWDFCLILFAPGDESPGYCHRCPLMGHQNRFVLALMPPRGRDGASCSETFSL